MRVEDIFKVLVTSEEGESDSELVTEDTLIDKVVDILKSSRNVKGFILEVEKVQ